MTIDNGPMPEKIAFTINEAEHVSGLSRSHVYKLIAEGHLPRRKVGRRTLILREDLEAYLRSCPSVLPPAREGSEIHSKIPAERRAPYSADDVVVFSNHRHRVVECPDGIQWILQVRAGSRPGTARFDNVQYFRTREALLRALRALPVPPDEEAMAKLARLPHRLGA